MMNSAEAAGMHDYCTCRHYADWHWLEPDGRFKCLGVGCECPDFVPTGVLLIDGSEGA